MNLVKVKTLTFEQHHDGRGVRSPSPRISWQFSFEGDSPHNWQQRAYDIQLEFLSSQEKLDRTVETSNSILEPWPGRPLRSGDQVNVRVRCYAAAPRNGTHIQHDNPTDWSAWTTVEAALLYPDDWSAQMVVAPSPSLNSDGSWKPIDFLTSFVLPQDRKIQSARLYITAHGCYQPMINDRRVGDHCMAPGWQSYKHRLHYQIFDVKDLLEDASENNICVTVGAGWFGSALAWAGGRRNMFGNELGLLAQLRVSFNQDGHDDFVLATNDSWKCMFSSILSSEIYNGEIYDMAADDRMHSSSSKSQEGVVVVDFDLAKLDSPETPPVRVTQEVKPVEMIKTPSGKTIIDFGQNLVGRLRISELKKDHGHTVSCRHAEVLENGELGTRPLRGAKAMDTIICDGRTLRDWTPKFTFHGFRYVQVEGWNQEDEHCPLTMESLVAQVMHSDMMPTGWFSCSNPLVNKLHENTVWSMRGNFLSVPTDCPQRDERLGWTGDIQVFAPSANYLYRTSGMLSNWLDDLVAEQMEPWRKGIPPFTVPDVITKAHEGDSDFWPAMANAVWDDVAVLLPWDLFMASGDHNLLRKQYDSMTTWIDKGIPRGQDGLWDPNIYQLGDWLDPMAPPSEPGNGKTDGVFVANAYLIRITAVMAQASAALGLEDDSVRYQDEGRRLKEVFCQKYVSRTGLLVSDTQAATALAIMFDLLDDEDKLTTAGQRLSHLVRQQQFRIATGFAGTPLIAHALTAVCQTQLAYRMLLEENCPSWLYCVKMGSTTIWERWDSMLPDGSINPGEMTSFNHYALGSIVNWLHQSVGGISPMEPGWKKTKIRPIPGGGLTHASAAHESPYGRIECSWSIRENVFFLDVLVPPNTNAYLVLPSRQKKKVGDVEEGSLIGSGRHHFQEPLETAEWPPEAIMPPFWPQKLPKMTV